MSVNQKIIDGDVLVIDDALPKTMYNTIKQALYSDKFLWNPVSSTAITTNIQIPEFENGLSFARTVYRILNNGMVEDQDPKLASLLCAAFMCAIDSAEISYTTLFRIRIGMILNTMSKYKFHYPHTDANFENLGAILYLTDCDAPTKIFNEAYDGSYDSVPNDPKSPPISIDDYSTVFLKEKYNFKLTTKIEVPCRENRIVFFNGRSYHSSSIPTDVERRIAVNFNFI